MSDADALLAAIRAAPADDAPRLVYADWLDEHGRPERAEFIRLQCALARRKSKALRRREAELLAAHHDAFAGHLAAPHLRFRFNRGFISGFGHQGVFWSKNPGTDPRTLTFLRFFADGRMTFMVNQRVPEHTLWWVADDAPRWPTTRYTVAPGTDSVGLVFEIIHSSWDVEYCGILRKGLLQLDAHKRNPNRRIGQRFVLGHVRRGFHSFPET